MSLVRFNQSNTVAVATSVATSGNIVFGDFSGGMVFVPTGSSLTTLTWYAATDETGTYLPVNNADGAVAQTVEGGKCYPIPEDLFGAVYLRIVGNAAGAVLVSLKG